ncbi:MAG: prephenate dehydrogenase [Chloroflexi bacterium]|nr:prephenate dehydrogenase [Chloroflexota bacterium]
MTVKITIIGLGRIGASMGLALANHKDQVTTLGHDKSPETARKAKKQGAVESISYNLPASIEGADVIVLAIPFGEIYETLKIITQDVREDAVVMDTGPVKSVVAEWAKELLPPKRHYVGLTPALNPACLEDAALGLNAARADLFQKGVIAVTAPQGTAEGALKLAADFVVLLGAQPFFADQAEVDGVMASAHLLPGLSAAALAETITGQPGWSDIRKLAGKSYSSATQPLDGEESAALAEAILQNRSNTIRVLDEYIATLASLRKDIAEENKKDLQTRLDRARRGRAKWQLERAKGDWLSVEFGGQEMPKVGDILKRQIGSLDKLFGRRDRKKPEAD